VGGRPPFGFRRWLAREDGAPVRQLIDGEYVKMAGHHVVWLPGPEEELAVVHRILEMLETMPASRVAATLTAEGVPTPDAGRTRSRRPGQNPLGARVFDMACGWPLYRQPYNGSFRYLCGLYQQSHGAECKHNLVAGPVATQFVLGCVRQRVLAPAFRSKLEA